MKNFEAFLVVIVILMSALTAFSQRRLNGKVVEIIDGKTVVVVVASTGGKLSVVLQNIEIPEPEQQLNGAVKDHLEKLLLGKSVLLTVKGVMNTRTVAQVFVADVDVSQQMLRDGAAWFAAADKTEKSGGEIAVYQSNEAQAKAEKRGVWSIEGLKPAWQFRAEKAERERAAELARLEEIKKQNREQYQKTAKKKLPPPPAAFSNFEMWKSGQTAGRWDELQMYMADRQFDENGLFKYKVPNANIYFVITRDAPIGISNGGSQPKVVCGIAYVTGGAKDAKAEKEFFGMGCRSEAAKQSFKEANQLVFSADGKKTSFGKAIHLGRQTDQRFDEMMVYFLDRDAVTKIAAANDVRVRIGDFSGTMPENFHSMIKHLVLASAEESVPAAR